MSIHHDVFSYEELLDVLEHMDSPPGFRSELVNGEIVLSPQGEEHSEIIQAGQEAARAAGLARWRSPSDVLTPFPEARSGFCPDVALLRSSAVRGRKPRPATDIGAVIEVVSGDAGARDYGIKVLEYASAGIDAYLIADPYKALCTLYTRPGNGVYEERAELPFGGTVRFTADGTDFVLDTSDWPVIR
jgi:Uma2 family endonuclease